MAGRLGARAASRSPVAESAVERVRALLRYPAPGRLASRHTVALRPTTINVERGLRWALLGGPLADLLLLVAPLGAACVWRSPSVLALAGCAALLLVLDLAPIDALENDLAALRTLGRGGAPADRLLALALLEGAVRDGQLPRAFDRGLILRATARPDGSRAAALADLFAYYRALDRDEIDAAEALLERLRHADARKPRALPVLVAAESAYLTLRLRRDFAAGNGWLQAEKLRGWWGERRLRAVKQAHPGPFVRIGVQGRIVLGQHALAQQQARAGLLAIARRPAEGPTAAQHALCEREWLRALLDQLDPEERTTLGAPAPLPAYTPVFSSRRAWDYPLPLMGFGALLAAVGAAGAWATTDSGVLTPDVAASKLHTVQRLGAAATVLALLLVVLTFVLSRAHRWRRELAVLGMTGGVGLVALGFAIVLSGPSQAIVGVIWLGGSSCTLGAGMALTRQDAGFGSLGGAVRALPLSRLLFVGMLLLAPVTTLIGSLAQHLSSASSSTPGLDRAAHAPAIRVRYVYDAGVPQYARDDVRRGVALAASYFWVTFGRTIERPVELDVTLGNAEPGALGYADLHQVHLGVGDVSEPLSSLELQNAVVHELFHVLQGELGEGNGIYGGPAWLVEGSADFVANEAQVWEGDVDESDVTACWQANVLAQPSLPSLPTLTSETLMLAGPGRYDLAALAVAEATHSVGVPALRTYFSDLATNDWQTAFHQAFGVDPQTFFGHYAALERSFNAPADACDALIDD